MYLCAAETTLNRRALLAAGCLCLRVDGGKQSDVHVSHSSAHWELAAGCRYRSPQRSYRVFSVISRSTNLQLHLFFSSFHFRSCLWTSRPTTQYNGVTRINGDWVRFCKTKEKLKFLYVAILGFSFLFLSSQCCGYVQALGWGSENIVVLQKTKPP